MQTIAHLFLCGDGGLTGVGTRGTRRGTGSFYLVTGSHSHGYQGTTQISQKIYFFGKGSRGAVLRKTPPFTFKNITYWVLVKSAGTPVPRYPVESESVVGADFRFWMGYHLLRKVLVPLKTFKFQKRVSLENLKAKE